MGNHYLYGGSGELEVCRGFISFLMVTAMADRETLNKLSSQVGEEQGLGVTSSETQSKTALGSSEKRALYQKEEIGLTAGGNWGGTHLETTHSGTTTGWSKLHTKT